MYRDETDENRSGTGGKVQDVLRFETEEDTNEERRVPATNVRTGLRSPLHHETPQLQAVRMGPGKEDFQLPRRPAQQRSVQRLGARSVQGRLRRLQASASETI